MGYKRADEILPEDVLMLVQNYISGASIYVPRKTEKSIQRILRNIRKTSYRNQEILLGGKRIESGK